MTPVVVRRLSPFSASDLFAVTADIEAYPQFLPNCTATRIHQRKGNELRVDNLFRWGVVPIHFQSHAPAHSPSKALRKRFSR